MTAWGNRPASRSSRGDTTIREGLPQPVADAGARYEVGTKQRPWAVIRQGRCRVGLRRVPLCVKDPEWLVLLLGGWGGVAQDTGGGLDGGCSELGQPLR
jgi:hypothetical protein